MQKQNLRGGITKYLSYIKRFSEKIKLQEGNTMQTLISWKTTLRKSLTNRTKSPSLKETKNCIYKVLCKYGEVFIGETRRHVATNLNEGKAKAQLGKTKKSGMAQHTRDRLGNIWYIPHERVYAGLYGTQRKTLEQTEVWKSGICTAESKSI